MLVARIIKSLVEVIINIISTAVTEALHNNLKSREKEDNMPTDTINKVLLVVSTTLFTSIVGLICYLYINDTEDLQKSIDEDHKEQLRIERRVDDAIESVLESKHGMLVTKNTLLEKIYNESIDTNNKINDIKTNSEIANKNYEVLSAKFDNFVIQSATDREVFVKKLEDHEQRLGLLEKNVTTIAREKNITLFGWKYGYGE